MARAWSFVVAALSPSSCLISADDSLLKLDFELELKFFLLAMCFSPWPFNSFTSSVSGGSWVALWPNWSPGNAFLTLITLDLWLQACWNCTSSCPTWGIEAEFSNNLFAKAWFSLSILSFSFLRTEMLSERGPIGCVEMDFLALLIA